MNVITQQLNVLQTRPVMLAANSFYFGAVSSLSTLCSHFVLKALHDKFD